MEGRNCTLDSNGKLAAPKTKSKDLDGNESRKRKRVDDRDSFDPHLDQNLDENEEGFADHEEDSAEELLDTTMLEIREGDDLDELNKQRQYYSVTKKTALTVWQPTLGVVEVTQIKGNFWKKTGFSLHGKNYLYPEEALYLLEKRQIASSKSLSDLQNQIFLSKEEVYELFFEEVLDFPAYLVYSKLKSLGYLPFRKNGYARVFGEERDILNLVARNPSKPLLGQTISYNLYCDGEDFSKSITKERLPVAYVLMTNGRRMFSFPLIMQIVKEAESVPLIIAIVTHTGNVFLEEFNDAEKVLLFHNLPNGDKEKLLAEEEG